MDKPNGYSLSRAFINWAFENPSKIKPSHYALYFFSIEHCNRLGWKKEFGLPSVMTMEAVGIKSHNTYINTFNDLIDFGFFECIERSKNQYSSNIIALSNFDKAPNKALDKALIKHASKHRESTRQSIDNIDKQVNNKPKNNKQEYYRAFKHLKITLIEYNKLLKRGYTKLQIDNILDSIENYAPNNKYNSLYLTAGKWLVKEHGENNTGADKVTDVFYDNVMKQVNADKARKNGIS